MSLQLNRRELLRAASLPLLTLPFSSALTSQTWPTESTKFRFHMIGNGHIDPVWLWPWPEGLSIVHSTFRSALDRMIQTPDFCFTASSAQFYEWVAENDPKMLEEIHKRVDEGRWAIVGGWWVEPDVNIPGGEALVRQGLYGQLAYRRLFGRTARVAYNPDSFGHTGSLPQILKLQGMEDYVFMRPQAHEKKLPADVFWWESRDGSRVLTYRIAFTYGVPGSVDKDLLSIMSQRRDEPVQDMMAFYGVGDHGGGATEQNIKSILAIRGQKGAPEVLFSTPDVYFAEIRSIKGLELPVVQDDLQMHAVGCYTAESEMKKNNRAAEIRLAAAEKLGMLASILTGSAYPRADFTAAWKKVLFLQFHDSLAGTSLPEHYVEAREAYGAAIEVASQVLYKSAQRIAWQISADDPKSEYLVVFNPHAWNAALDVEYDLALPPGFSTGENAPKRHTVLQDDGSGSIDHQWVQATTVIGRRRLVFRATVPAFGYRQFRVRAVEGENGSSARVRAEERALENEHLRVTLDDDGRVAVFDKDAGHSVFSGTSGGARGVVLDDPSDTWSHNIREYSKEIGTFRNAVFRVLEDGPWRARLRTRSTYGQSSLEIDWLLQAGCRNLEARVALDWHEHLKMLKMSFPVEVQDPAATCEIAYGFIARPTDGTEVPGQRWIDLSGRREGKEYGLTVINDAKYGYSIRGNDIRISAVRGAVYAQHIPHELEPDGVYIWQDQGLQTFRILLVPHQGTWQDAGIVRLTEEFTTPVPIIYQGIHRGTRPAAATFLSVDAPNVVVSAVKEAESGEDLIIRCYETAGRPVRATLDMGLARRQWTGNFRPSEIKTLRIPRAAGKIREVNLLEE